MVEHPESVHKVIGHFIGDPDLSITVVRATHLLRGNLYPDRAAALTTKFMTDKGGPEGLTEGPRARTVVPKVKVRAPRRDLRQRIRDEVLDQVKVRGVRVVLTHRRFLCDRGRGSGFGYVR